jgi:crotonobetaine/carnitine-CoA ligase
MSALLAAAARRYGSAPALELPENDERFNFVELASRVGGLVATLGGLGVGAGDRILLALDNRSLMPAMTFAASELGAATFAINPGYTPTELEYVLGKMRPRCVVALPEFCSTHEALLAQHVPVVTSVDKATPRSRLFNLQDGPWESLGSVARLDDVVSYAFSSGSTGFPKAVPRRQRQWMRIGEIIADGMTLGSDDRVITAQPLYYGDPFYCLMGTLTSGGCMVILGRFRSETFIELLVASRATKFLTIGVVPTMLMNTPVTPLDRAHRLRVAWSVAVPREIHADLESRFGCPWYEVYGTAETATVFMENFSRPDRHEPGSGWVGAPAPGVEVRLIGDDGGTITGDGQGLLEVRSAMVMRGYYRGDEETARVLTTDGWYKTGDRFLREGARYRFLNREKDIVRRSGENVSAMEVEEALRRDARVLDAAIVPRPDPVRGEEVWAFLMPAPGQTVASLESHAEEVLVEVGRHLARHKVPRFVTVLDAFPRTASEKTVKRELPGLSRGRVFDRVSGEWSAPPRSADPELRRQP